MPHTAFKELPNPGGWKALTHGVTRRLKAYSLGDLGLYNKTAWCLAGNGGMDPCSSPYIFPNNSPHNPFPHALLGTKQKKHGAWSLPEWLQIGLYILICIVKFDFVGKGLVSKCSTHLILWAYATMY